MFDPGAPFDPAGDVMRHYRLNALDAEFVSLKHYEIKDLVPLMGHLSEMRNMKQLVLSDNLISRLPEDLSALTKLETLDLTRNPIPNAASVIRGLYSLPRLQNLLINLPEEDEDQIVATLGHLRTLNGVPLDTEASDRDVQSAQSLLQSLRTGTSVTVPRGYSAASRAAATTTVPYRAWTDDHVIPLRKLQDLVRKVSGNLSNTAEYNDYTELVESHVRSRTKNEPDTLRASASQFLAKGLLIEYSFDELVRSAAKFGPEVADALHALFEAHVNLVADASQILVELQEDRDRKLDAIQEDLAKELLIKERVGVNTTEAHSPQRAHFLEGNALNPLKPAPTHSSAMNELVMPITELRALLQLFFDSKKKHDAANNSARLPCETVEQHMFTFLYTRTSSDEEIKQRVTTIFNSVRFHSKKELDVEVLSLILRHELDEDYWHIFAGQRAAVYDAIQSVLATSTSGARSGYLDELQAADVVKTLSTINSAQSDNILRSVERALIRDEDADRYIIAYTELGNTILKCFVSSYLASIRRMSQAFRQHDPEKSGVISVGKLRVLLSTLFPGISSARSQELIRQVDPYMNEVATFSSVARTLKALTNQYSVSTPEPSMTSRPQSSKAPTSRPQ